MSVTAFNVQRMVHPHLHSLEELSLSLSIYLKGLRLGKSQASTRRDDGGVQVLPLKNAEPGCYGSYCTRQ